MRANNFTVDDWILYEDKPYRIISVTKRKVGLHVYRYNATYIRLPEVRTIEITPEILERNSFKKTNEDGYISEDGRILINKLSNSVGKDWYCHIDNEDFESVGCADVHYVHELQHILRLCGIEKEIEL